jgi:hypothetical protein
MLGFGLHYLQVKDNLKTWKAKKMLKVEIVKRHLAQFQIYSNIGISDSTTMWYGFGSRCVFSISRCLQVGYTYWVEEALLTINVVFS